ncbi:histidine phosphotransferase family protein [Nisaea nitritireducens]|uniref:histidine phosphotransferase family protein n=1 Tax=Nisaea nitritireducens TaxID=568392 RepID=UPI0018691D1E|nr:histidine phosphotransferase family protein [Nisaea nitritireducens]
MPEHMTLIDMLLSRLFHDLISPVSATVNGAELISDLGGNGSELEQEALALIGTSARQASERLSFFRVAFGGAGSNTDHSLADGAKLAAPYLKARKIDFSLDCPVDPKLVRPASGGIKVLLGLICFMCECLPRGGSISLVSAGEQGGHFELMAEGVGANVPDDIRAALDLGIPTSDLTSKSVVAHVAAVNAERFGYGIAVEEETGRVKVDVNFT